jgi:hypothetical protein
MQMVVMVVQEQHHLFQVLQSHTLAAVAVAVTLVDQEAQEELEVVMVVIMVIQVDLELQVVRPTVVAAEVVQLNLVLANPIQEVMADPAL